MWTQRGDILHEKDNKFIYLYSIKVDPSAARSETKALMACTQRPGVRIPFKACAFVTVRVVLSCIGRGLWNELICRPKESYQVFKQIKKPHV